MMFVAALAAFGLIAGACGDKKDDAETAPSGTEAESGTETTVGDGAADTTAAPEEEATTTAAPEAAPTIGGKLIVAGEAEVANPWTPAQMQCDSYCQMRARTFFDPLVVVDQDLQPQPFLAESVTPNDDFTEWTVKLREGITFHDGLPLDADAAIKNLRATGGGLLVAAAVKDVAQVPTAADPTKKELKIEKVDDLTFTIFMGKDGNPDQPLSWPLFAYYLGGQLGFMASPAWLDAVAAGTGKPDQPVGTGPFVFDSYAPGDKLVVKKNPSYWLTDADGNTLPYLDEIEFRVIPDSQTRGDALRAGDVNMIATSDASVIADFQDAAEFPIVEQSEYGETSYTMLHLSKAGPLQDQRVRCALDQAIDKVDLIDTVAGGIVDPANGPFSPGQEGYLEDNGELPYDPDAAKAAIDEYEAETGTQVSIIYSTTTANTSLLTAQYVQDAWAQIGVDTEIAQIEQSKLINNALFGDPAFDAFGWRNHAGLFVDQQYFWWHGSAATPDGGLALNFGRLNDPVINDLLDQSRVEADADARRGIAEEINKQFAKECWILPAWYTKWGVIHDGVGGIGNSPLPDGGTMRDGAGFPGQVWLTAAFLAS
ncbi:MAG: ABC transporter substrate-binding protein [Acidimicrobiia bacterium]